MLGASSADLDIAGIAKAAILATSPTDDVHASASYRTRVGAVMAERALTSAIKGASNG
jgi:CO/xanthine dehydrogenase FAD-binding subunit